MIKVHGSGRLTTRNRKFLRKITPYGSDTPAYTSTPPSAPSSRLGEESESILPELPQISEEYIPLQPVVEIEGTGRVPVLPEVEDTVQEEPRRSSRIRHVPDRLNIESTRGQSYFLEVKNTACMSVSVSTTSFQSGLVGGKASMMMEDDCLAR